MLYSTRNNKKITFLGFLFVIFAVSKTTRTWIYNTANRQTVRPRSLVRFSQYPIFVKMDKTSCFLRQRANSTIRPRPPDRPLSTPRVHTEWNESITISFPAGYKVQYPAIHGYPIYQDRICFGPFIIIVKLLLLNFIVCTSSIVHFT